MVSRTSIIVIVWALAVAGVASAAAPPVTEQLRAAVLAAPEDRRDGAGVLGYDDRGTLVTLREAKNDLVCLADDPAREGFEVACYHRDLEPYMARGRALRAEGILGEKSYEVRWNEIEKGTLAMAREPRLLYLLQGTAFDPVTGVVTDEYRRWVIYWPYATPESTGLSTKGQGGAPWLMFPGTAGAHIMISPPRAKSRP